MRSDGVRLSPLNALRVFHAVMRHGSFRGAADDLLVSPQAVSQQIKLLEDTLAVVLFDRRGRSIVPTEAAVLLAYFIQSGFDEFREGVRRVARVGQRDRIDLNVSPYFATRYLVDRLDRFRARLPGADIRIKTMVEMPDFAADEVDVAIQWGFGQWRDYDSTLIVRDPKIVCCSPALAARLAGPEDLARAPLVHLVLASDLWPRVLAHLGVVGATVRNEIQVHDAASMRRAGLAGLGGAKIRLVMADHQADPQKGRSEAERLITQSKVAAIVGTYHSSVAATVSVTCERYGIPCVIGDSSSPSLHRRNLKYFFRPAAHDEMFSVAIFDLLDAERKKGAKIDTVALFCEDTIFGVDSANVQRKLATERGYKLVADVKYKSNSPSLTAEVQQIKSADADVVLPSTYTTDAILLVKTMAELGYKPRNMVAQAAGFAEKATFESVGDKLDGLISRGSFALDLAAKRPSVGIVNAMFKARAGRDLNDNTARLVEAMLLLADAIDRARSTDGAKIRDALAATNTPAEQTIMPWRGIAFGPNGQNTLCDPVLIQYRGGTFITVFPDAFAAAAPKWPMNA